MSFKGRGVRFSPASCIAPQIITHKFLLNKQALGVQAQVAVHGPSYQTFPEGMADAAVNTSHGHLGRHDALSQVLAQGRSFLRAYL